MKSVAGAANYLDMDTKELFRLYSGKYRINRK